MKNKIYCLSLAILAGSVVFAETIPLRTFPSSTNRTAIQSSNIRYSNPEKSYDAEAYLPAIKEIQVKIDQNSNDYGLYASLADLYIKTAQYDKAFDELIFLSNLARQNKLSSDVLLQLNNMYQNYKPSVRYDASRYPMYVDLAILALIQKDIANAENYLVAASETGINSDILKNALTVVFDNTQNLQKAVTVCNRILTKNPNDMEIRKLKASYLLQLGNKQAASEEYSKILSLNPNDTDSKYFLYTALEASGIPEKELVKKLYKTDKPDYEKGFYEIADMLLKKNETSAALKYANILVDKFPENANGYILLSEIYKKEGKLQESYDALAKVREKADSNEAIAKYNVMLAKLSDQPVQEANSLMANGMPQQALEVLESADQDALYVILTQSRAYYLLNKKQNTFDLLNKAMTLYPENSDVYCAFGYIYLQEKDIDTARKYVNRSLKINPQNRTAQDLLDMVNQAETDKGMSNIIANYESQNYAETMRLIDEALEINKKDPELYYYKALTYIAQNNYAASTSSLYKCIELNKNHALAYFYLGMAFDNLSEPNHALVNYQKFIDILPPDAFEESEKRDYAKSRINKIQQKS